jgi:parallel beta-helix repeat protein
MLRSGLRAVSVCLLALISAVTVNAATYYVSNSGSPACANNASNGSEAKPWCTITYGIGHLASGDTLLVKSGTYNEQPLINGPAGTASAPTVIKTYPGATVTIMGAGVDGGRVKIENTSYITLDGFIITNFNQGIHVNTSDHIIVQNNTVHHVGQEGIHVQFNSSFVTVQNNTVHDTRQWQYNGEGIYVGSGSTVAKDSTNNVTVKGNTVYHTNDEGIEIKDGTHDNIIDGNNVSAALLDPAYASPTSGSIEIDEAVNVGGGNQSWPSNPNHIIRNNVVHDSKTGIRLGTGCTAYNNLIYNTVSPYQGIYADNLDGDSYTRNIYHNTIDIPSSRAIVVVSAAVDMRNNIGPTGTNNMAVLDSFFANKPAADYHLAAGSAPINAGVNLTNIVATDITGASRLASPPPDMGAYEFTGGGSSVPSPPTNLSATTQ